MRIISSSSAKTLIAVLKQALAIVLVAYGLVILLVYAIPHLPLANNRTFHAMLKAQMTVDHSEQLTESGKEMVLFLGSSVVERGVAEHYLDTLLNRQGLTNIEVSNSGTGGFFAKANLPMFRAMLERGLRPSRVIYGFFLQELNEHSNVHANVNDKDTSDLKLKEKTLWNVIRYGPTAIYPLFNGNSLHQYLFAANNGFREVRDPNFLDKLMFGENVFERDSSYKLSSQFLEDLKQIYYLCKERNIPFAFYNTPIRPKIESLADLPYLHREENYSALYNFAKENNIPLWNLDTPGLFETEDFQDTYHLTPDGARRMSEYLAVNILRWSKGEVIQDKVKSLFNNDCSSVLALHSN